MAVIGNGSFTPADGVLEKNCFENAGASAVTRVLDVSACQGQPLYKIAQTYMKT